MTAVFILLLLLSGSGGHALSSAVIHDVPAG